MHHTAVRDCTSGLEILRITGPSVTPDRPEPAAKSGNADFSGVASEVVLSVR